MDAAAIARPYAAAAFQHARAQDAIDDWQRALGQMAQAIGAVEEIAAAGALVSGEQAAEIALAAAAAGGGADEPQKRFVALLAENDRVFALPAIAARFDALRMEDANIVAAAVESALPIDDKAGFAAHLEKRLGKKVQATYRENPDLLGGARVYVNDDVIDASIRGRLERLAATLSGNAAA